MENATTNFLKVLNKNYLYRKLFELVIVLIRALENVSLGYSRRKVLVNVQYAKSNAPTLSK